METLRELGTAAKTPKIDHLIKTGKLKDRAMAIVLEGNPMA